MRHQKWMLFGAGVVLLACAVFTGCFSSSNGKVRLVNGTLDKNSLDLLVDSSNKAPGVAYGTASSYVSVSSGSRNLQAEETGTTNIIATASASVSKGAFLTFMTLNCSSCGTAPVVFTDNNAAPSAGNFNLRIINASPGLLAQDVYVVQPPADITTMNPTYSSLGFGSASVYSSQAAGNWEVIFTPPNSKTIDLDSGTLSFSALQVRTVVSLNAQAGGYEAEVLSDLN